MAGIDQPAVASVTVPVIVFWAIITLPLSIIDSRSINILGQKVTCLFIGLGLI